jgi:hypothetical protein
LPDGWDQMEFADFLIRRRRLMADVVRDAFMRLCDSGYQPVYPEGCAASRGARNEDVDGLWRPCR